jgi:hypothetical protein
MNKEAKRKRNKEVTPEFDGYLEEKIYTPKFQVLHVRWCLILSLHIQ